MTLASIPNMKFNADRGPIGWSASCRVRARAVGTSRIARPHLLTEMPRALDLTKCFLRFLPLTVSPHGHWQRQECLQNTRCPDPPGCTHGTGRGNNPRKTHRALIHQAAHMTGRSKNVCKVTWPYSAGLHTCSLAEAEMHAKYTDHNPPGCTHGH